MSMFVDDTIPHLQKMPRDMQKIFSLRLPTLRFLKKTEFPFKINMLLVYPKYIFILVPQNSFTIKIENKHIYQSLKVMFLELYKKTYTIETKNIFKGIEK